MTTLKLALISVLLAGCTTPAPPPLVQTVEVKVPVAVPCHTEPIPVPKWPLDNLPPGADIAKQVAAMLAEIEMRVAYEIKLNAALNACE